MASSSAAIGSLWTVVCPTVIIYLCVAVAADANSLGIDDKSINSPTWHLDGKLASALRVERSLSSSSWMAKVLSPIRQLMGTRAHDPWRYFMTVKRRDMSGRRSSSSSFSGYAASIPDEFDARQRWPYCPTIGEVFEQGPCASCWAVATTDVMSDRICIRTGGRRIVRLSAGNLLSCCRLCGNGCKGGFPGGAWIHWKKHGIVTGAAYSSNYGCQNYPFFPCYDPMVPGTSESKCSRQDKAVPKCSKTCRNSYQNDYKQDLHYGESVYRIPNDVEAIQLEILENGPVQANLRVYQDFLHYQSGVFKHEFGSGLEYHAVKIFGWGIDTDGTPYWLATNPWSKYWGDGGFFKILRGSNHAEIEAHVMAGIPKVAPEEIDDEQLNLI